MRRSEANASTLEFVADSASPEIADDRAKAWVETPANPGGRFDASPFPELLQGLEAPAADRRYTTTDQWGIALSGYASIKDESGQAIALLGVDMSQLDVAARFAKLDRALFVTLLSSGILSALGTVLVAATVIGLWSRQRFET